MIQQKNILRASLRRRLDSVAPDERAERSGRMARRIAELATWRQASQVLLFAPLPTEPNLDLLWRNGALADKRVAYPRVEGKLIRLFYVDRLEELRETRWGLREPPQDADREAALDSFGVALVPGMAFDVAGGRLGRGGGFYDRLLARRDPTKTRLVGVGFAFQVLAESLPLDAHDVKMDEICTD